MDSRLLRQDCVDVRRNEAREIVDWSVERENLAEAWAADRQVPPLARLRAENGQPPQLEGGAPASDDDAYRLSELRPHRGIDKLWAGNRDGHQMSAAKN